MIISFSPIRCDADLVISKSGDTLTINGDPLDFSDLPEGGEYPREAIDNEFVVGGIKRLDGVIHITVMLPYSNPDAPTAVTFPDPITVTGDGVIALPEGRTVEIDDAAQ
ncbi:hypothetical protein DKP76_07050 [Falsochrobactrum shanghaiense]|uniref:Uncharacterized protein n=1 Tax=Falsochrobactrum shanghaiense TaxID=2201899 RepID=A0A316JBI6_9HYPH|nr:hypothetical protein [Falsochrobactrum shanghaiense]PWL18814.1 hypothetical protein DKP76_07050 [Falsochrobactrum shanghaiense]